MENENLAQPQSAPIVETPPVASTPRKKMPLIIFIIFLVLGLAAGGIYYFTKQQSLQAIKTVSPAPTPDLTADWKTYTNNELGFSFKYPTSWIVETLTVEPYLATIELSPSANKDAPVWALSINLSKESYEAEVKKEKLSDREEVTIADEKGRSGPYKTSPSGWTGKTIVLPYKENSLIIRVQKDFEKDIDQILSTFKFL